MIDITTVRIGQRVHYIPPEGYDKFLIENGIVKEIPKGSRDSVRVVYKCDGDWKQYMNYTSALTKIKDLNMGWYY